MELDFSRAIIKKEQKGGYVEHMLIGECDFKKIWFRKLISLYKFEEV